MPYPISSEQRETFERDGVLVLSDLVDDCWLDRIRTAIERDITSPGPFYHGYETTAGGRFHGNLRLWETDPVLREFCFESCLPDVAAGIFGTHRVNLFYDQLFVKETMTDNRTRWHNDQPYWPITGRQVLSFWVALDETTLESGALEFIRGSQNWNRWFQPEAFGPNAGQNAYQRNPDYEDIPDIEADRPQYDIVSWDLSPGDAYVFHGLIVHGSPGNASRTRRRRGYAVRYTGSDVVYDTRPGTNEHLLIAGLHDGDPIDSSQCPVVRPIKDATTQAGIGGSPAAKH